MYRPTHKSIRRSALLSAVVAAVMVSAIGVSEARHSVGAIANVGIFELDGNALDDRDGIDEFVDVYNGSTLLANDSAFFVDGGGATDALAFVTGGSKDENPMSSWRWDTGVSILSKNDVSNAYVATYTGPAGTAIAGEPIYTLGLDRFGNTGAASFGFWLIQDEIALGQIDVGGGPEPDNVFVRADDPTVQSEHSEGDILLVANLVGAVPEISVYEWTGGALSFLASASTACDDSTPDTAPICGVSNFDSVETAPWPYEHSSGSTDFQLDTYLEAAVNLERVLGADNLGCYQSLIVESRSSQQSIAQQKDLYLASFDSCGLTVTKTGPAQAAPGDEVIFSFDIENTGIVPLESVSLVDDVLGDISAELVADGCGLITGGATCTVDYAWTVDDSFAATDDTITNTAVVTFQAPNGRVELSAEDAHVMQLLVSSPDLSIEKTNNAEMIVPGTVTTYELRYSNVGSEALDGVAITETVPAGAVFRAANSTPGWSCADGASAGTSCELLVGAVDVGARGSAEFAVEVSSALTGEMSNTATISDDGAFGPDVAPSNNSSTDADVLSPLADVAIGIADTPDPVPASFELVYTLTAANLGPSDASDVEARFRLPAGAIAFVAAIPETGTCAELAGLVTCDLGVVAAGTSVGIEIEIAVGDEQVGELSGNATITTSTPETDVANNTAVEITSVTTSELSIAKSVDDGTPEPGETVTYVLTLDNAGDFDIAGVAVDDVLPAGLLFVSSDASVGGYDADTGRWLVGTVAAASSASLRIAVTVGPAEPGTTVVNTATVSNASPVNPDPSARTASVSITINEPPTATNGTYAASVGAPAVGNVLTDDTLGMGVDSDADGVLDLTSVVAGAGVTNGTLILGPDGSFTYTPNAGFVGQDSFTYTVRDDDGARSNVATVIIDVSEFGGPGVGLGVLTGSVWHDVDADGTIAAFEDELTGVKVDLVGAGADRAFGTADDTTASAFTASPFRFEGLADGLYRVTIDLATLPGSLTTSTFDVDGGNDATVDVELVAGRQTTSINFGFVNLVPAAKNDEATVVTGAEVRIPVLANDVDPESQELSVASIGVVFNGSARLNADGTVSYTPNPGFVGVDSFTVTVCDPGGKCSVAVVVVTVIADRNAPTLTSGTTVGAAPGQSIPPLTAVAPGGGVVTFTLVSGVLPAGLTLNADGSFSGSVSSAGSSAFTVEMCDASGVCRIVTITLRIAPSSALAASGASTNVIIRWALSLFGAGAFLHVVCSRRRRHLLQTFGERAT